MGMKYQSICAPCLYEVDTERVGVILMQSAEV